MSAPMIPQYESHDEMLRVIDGQRRMLAYAASQVHEAQGRRARAQAALDEAARRLAEETERYRELRASIGWGESLDEVTSSGPVAPRPMPERGIVVEFRSRDGLSQFEIMQLPLRLDHRRLLRPSDSPASVWGESPEPPPWEDRCREYELRSGGAVPVYLEKAR